MHVCLLFLDCSVSWVVDRNLSEAWEKDSSSFRVMGAAQVLRQAGQCSHTVAVRLELGEFSVGRLGRTLGHLVDVLDGLEEDEVDEAHISAKQELSVIVEQICGSCFESLESLFNELFLIRALRKYDLCPVHDALVADGVQLHDSCLIRERGAEQLWLELSSDVSMDRKSLSHIDAAIDDEGQIGKINGAAVLEFSPVCSSHFEVLLLPIGSTVGEQVATDVSSVKTSELPVAKFDFVTSGLCHSTLSLFLTRYPKKSTTTKNI